MQPTSFADTSNIPMNDHICDIFLLGPFSEILTPPKLIPAVLKRKKVKDEIFSLNYAKIGKDLGGLGLQYISFCNVSITIYISWSFWFQFLSHVEIHHRVQCSLKTISHFLLHCFPNLSIKPCSSSHHLNYGANTVVKAHFLDKVRSSMFCYNK